MTNSTKPEIVQIDPAQVVIGTNVRGDARLDKQFVASVRERGVLTPVTVYRNDEDAYVLVYGQRRTLAAVETKTATIPAYVVASPEEADRLIDQLAENDHRRALTSGERAQAFEQLAVVGLSAAQIAKRTATKRADVDAGLAVAKSELAIAAADRYDFLTLDQAVVIAEFENDAEAVKALTVAAHEGRFEHAAQRLMDDRDREQTRAALVEALTEQGVTVIDNHEWDEQRNVDLYRLAAKAEGKAYTDKTHAKCPGHAAYVVTHRTHDDEGPRFEAAANYVCTDWKAQGHTNLYAATSGSSKPKAADMTDEEREAAKAARRDVIESNKAWEAAESVRREWVKQFLTRKTAPKGSAEFIAYAMFTGADRLSHHSIKDTLAALGMPVESYDDTSAADTIAKASEGRALVLALGYALAAHENMTHKGSWRSVSAHTARYLTFIEANGYTLSEVEHRAAGTKPKAKPTK